MSEASRLDLGIGDVHVPGPVAVKPKAKSESLMADLTTKQRNSLPASKFADPEGRGYPISDKAHADNAAARLEQQKGSMSAGKYARIKSRIKAAQRRFGEKPKTNGSSFRGSSKGLRMSVRHPDGTHVEVRHMAAYAEKTDTLYLTFLLDATLASTDAAEGKRVWVQVGKPGRWLGHPQGAFELNAQVFDALVRNFKTQTPDGIQYDFEHSSEMRPTDGSIPSQGAPAQGWIYDLKADGRGLFALTEWKGLAKDYIAAGQYKGVSPAIHWKMKDRTTGQPIGPVLTSVALTNKPFLTGMKQPSLNSTNAAIADAVELTSEEDSSEPVATNASGYCYSTSEYMPRIKSALRLSELSTPTECSDHLDKLREHFAAAGGDANANHQGIRLSDYMMPMRNMVGASMGMSWEEVLDIVEDLIHAAIEEHEAKFHEGEEPDGDDANDATAMSTTAEPTTQDTSGAPIDAPVSTTEEDTTMATPEESTKLLATAQTEVQTLSATVKVKDGEIESLKAENKTLASWKTEREEKDVQERVSAAIETYKDKNKTVSEENRAELVSLCRASIASFDKLFPAVSADKRHLLRTFTNDGRKPADGNSGPRAQADAPTTVQEPQPMNLLSLADYIAKERGCEEHVAMIEAERIMKRAGKK